MADRIKQELNGTDEKAEAAAAPASAKSGGFKAFLPLAITIVLMPAAAWAMTQFVLIPKLQKSLGIAPAHRAESPGNATEASASGKEGADKGAPKQSVAMTKLLVNVAGTMGSRYLLASVTLVGTAPDFKARVEKNEPQLRDMAMTALATKTITDLEKPASRNLVRSELLSGFNNILGGSTVQEIYITEFAIQ